MSAVDDNLLLFQQVPVSEQTALASLAQPLRAWFTRRFGAPTPAQRHAWPVLAAGHSLLLSAPTGTGKTLAAFLPIFSQLLPGTIIPAVRCLYLAPLKALVNDIRANLRRHLGELTMVLRQQHSEIHSPITIGSRTGDSSSRARRRLLSAPPDILLTTPESLAILLTHPPAREVLLGVRWVIVDELHALAGTRRGCDLALGLERLEALVGEPLQRIGLSATVTPLAEAAHFLVGSGRPCVVAAVSEESRTELRIEPLRVAAGAGPGFLAQVVNRLEPEIARNRSTLIFTNTRALAERLAYALRQRLPALAEQVAVHHSGVAAGRRRITERRLKQGQVRVALSSTTLELGIDIGTVDGVVLVHPPGGVVRLWQRLGRAGHAPGQCRRGLVLTASAAELLEAAVTRVAGATGELEPLRVPDRPLDILCQHLLGLACQGPWCADEVFALVRRAWPYRQLPRDEFDGCLNYLLGRISTQPFPPNTAPSGSGEWLPPRLRLVDGRLALHESRLVRLVRRNLGTILGENLVGVWQQDGPCLGQVDHTFADRLQPGDRFLLEGRCLEFVRLERGRLLVRETLGRPGTPCWVSEGLPLSPELARRLFFFRIRAAEALLEGEAVLRTLLAEEYGLAEQAVAELVEFFLDQETLSEIPDARSLLIEAVSHEGEVTWYLHTPLHRAGNEVLVRVASQRLLRAGAVAVVGTSADLGFSLAVRGGPKLTPDDWRLLLSPGQFERELDEALADSPALRERFRRAALTGLMLLRQPRGGRRRVGGHDWVERRLFERVRRLDPDFVLLTQARRDLYQGLLDVPVALQHVTALSHLEVRYRWLREPSPFARAWIPSAPSEEVSSEGPAEALARLQATLEILSEAIPTEEPGGADAGS